MLLYDIIEERYNESLIRESKEISTERGRMKREYTGRIRVLRNKVTRRKRVEEEYYLIVGKVSEIDYKFHLNKEIKTNWERRR